VRQRRRACATLHLYHLYGEVRRFEACVEVNLNLYVGTLVEVIMSVGLSLNLYAER
jgi:hypothetical protein